MIVQLLVDEEVDPDIVKGLRLRAPDIDIRDVKLEGLRGTRDEVLLDLGYSEDRVLVSYDKRTMTRDRLADGRGSPGLFVLSRKAGIGEIIDALLLTCVASSAEECRNRIVFLPYR